MKAALRREHGVNLDKDRIARLMAELGIRGASRSKTTVTTRPDKHSARAPDLVNRQSRALRPNQLWVCDFTYRSTWSGFAYTAFVIDVHSRMIVGWRIASTMTADLVTDALDMAIFSRRTQLLHGVIAHSDESTQNTSVAHTERLAEIHALASIGSIGDSYDNAMAESVNGLYKNELIRRQGPWRNAEHVELERSPTSIGSTTAGCTANLATSHQPNSSTTTTLEPGHNIKPQHPPGPDAKDRPIQHDAPAIQPRDSLTAYPIDRHNRSIGRMWIRSSNVKERSPVENATPATKRCPKASRSLRSPASSLLATR